jgi:hypothetical protein
MKRTYTLVILALFFARTEAQQFAWAKTEGKYAYDYGYGIQTDNSGNVYVAGKYEENSVFSGTTVSCAGNHDAFLVKYGADGSLVWIRTAGGPLGDYAQSMYCDGSSAVYIGGEMEGYGVPIYFGNNATLTCIGDNDAFFAKYDLDGNFQWAKSFGSLNSEKVLAITADGNQNVYIAGYFTNTTTVNGNNITGYGGRDIYVAKYDKDGVFQWFKYAGSDKRDEVKSIRCDAQGNVYVCGWMSNNAKFGSQTMITFNNTGYADAFIAKYASNGDLVWVRTGGGDFDDVAWSMVFDSQGSIYMTGEYNAYAEFGGKNVTTTGEAEVFVVKYNTNGDVLWLKSAGSSKVDRARGIGTDGSTMFVTGQFGGAANSVASFGGSQVTSVDTSDVFIAAISGNGDWLWATSIGGPADKYEPLGYESGIAVTGHAGGNVYATGGILCDPDIASCKNNFGSIQSGSWTRTDIFVAKLTWDVTTVGVSKLTQAEGLRVYPNPAQGKFIFTLNGGDNERVTVNIYNTLGQRVCSGVCTRGGQAEFQLGSYPDGVYVAEVTADGQPVSSQKLILQH